ncbi:MAG TPA: homoserine kinase [Patescibacteria group bacterium]|nr:homoserine kinase [Patescibacteria group bacterium]
MKVIVSVPGTSANLGPGYDVFGLALTIGNTFTVEDSGQFAIFIKNDKEDLPKTKENLFYQAFIFLFNKLQKKIPTVKITMDLNLPQGGGLGSSATAVVGGMLAANSFLGEKYTRDELLPYIIEMERGQNPDNVTPALFGGMVVMTSDKGKLVYIPLRFPKKIKAILYTPNFAMDTAMTRKLMPTTYSKEDVVFSTGRVGLFLAALQTKKYELFRLAMQDIIHQPTRTKIFPQMPKLIAAANESGALGAALSGGGSSIIAFADKNSKKIAEVLEKTGQMYGLQGRVVILTANNTGARVRVYD